MTNRFRMLWNEYAKQVGRDYCLVFLVALGLFWSVYWAFVLPFLAIHTFAIIYLYFVKKYHADYFSVLLISILLANDPIDQK